MEKCCGEGKWTFLLGVGLGVAASLAVVMLVAAEPGQRTRAELGTALESLKARLEALSARLSTQGQEVLGQQRQAWQAAMAAGRQAAQERKEELQERLRQT